MPDGGGLDKHMIHGKTVNGIQNNGDINSGVELVARFVLSKVKDQVKDI